MQSATGQSTNTSVFGYRKLNTTALKIGNVPKWAPDNEQQVKVSEVVENLTYIFYITHTTPNSTVCTICVYVRDEIIN